MNSNWSYSPETPNLGQIRRFLEPCDLEIWRMTLKNNRAPLLCYLKLCASFRSHLCIQTGVTVRKRPIWVKFDDFQSRVTLKFDGWPWKTINRAPLLCCFQLCARFHCHMWIQTGVRVRKRLSWVLTSVTLTFDLWPWPFAWTSLLTMVITPENFMMIRWWEHGELECGTWYHHPRRLQCALSRNLRIFKVATWHCQCRHNLKNNCIWDNLQCCLLVPRSHSKPAMLTFDLQSWKV